MLGCGDRDRTAGRDLARERRDDAAAAAEHVAEAHRAEAVRPAATLASTICSPTHFDAPITLAGRTALSVEMNTKRSTPTRDGRVDDVARADDVGDDRLARVVLEQRHVLVRGGVEHDLGPVAVEHRVEERGVADVDEQLDDRVLRRSPPLTVLAKHDERYMPREVVDALKKSGRWQEEEMKNPGSSPRSLRSLVNMRWSWRWGWGWSSLLPRSSERELTTAA